MNASFSFSFFFILFYFVECFFLNSCWLFPVNKTGSWKGIFCWNCLEVFSSPVEQGPFSRQVSFIFQDQKLSLSQCVYGVLLTVWFSVVVLSFPRLKFDFFFFFWLCSGKEVLISRKWDGRVCGEGQYFRLVYLSVPPGCLPHLFRWILCPLCQTHQRTVSVWDFD